MLLFLAVRAAFSSGVHYNSEAFQDAPNQLHHYIPQASAQMARSSLFPKPTFPDTETLELRYNQRHGHPTDTKIPAALPGPYQIY